MFPFLSSGSRRVEERPGNGVPKPLAGTVRSPRRTRASIPAAPTRPTPLRSRSKPNRTSRDSPERLAYRGEEVTSRRRPVWRHNERLEKQWVPVSVRTAVAMRDVFRHSAAVADLKRGERLVVFHVRSVSPTRYWTGRPSSSATASDWSATSESRATTTHSEQASAFPDSSKASWSQVVKAVAPAITSARWRGVTANRTSGRARPSRGASE